MNDCHPIVKVYIAGALGPNNSRTDACALAIEYLFNCNDMIDMYLDLIQLGFTPFCPALDLLVFLNPRAKYIMNETVIYNQSLAWLRECDAMVLTANWKNSKGTKAEIKFAYENCIPVFYSMEEFLKENINE